MPGYYMAVMAIMATAVDATTSMHGAGSTTSDELFWEAMEMIKDRSRMPLHLTYRAVGSSTGQNEFVGAQNGFVALNHFGAGDMPMTSARYTSVTGAGRQMVHVPFAMDGIGVFHSVPTLNLGGQTITLSACVLAKIVSGQITAWDHTEITALNPTLTYTGAITAVHQVGSSSTTAFTSYLSAKCPASWTLGSGSTIASPAGTLAVQGSDAMVSSINLIEGAIGYVAAGSGHTADLSEIALPNNDGVYLTTRQADLSAAADVAVTAGVFPADPTSDFSAVNLYDLPGPTTWPITLLFYFYLDTDWSSMDATTAGVLMYFVNFLLGSSEGQALVEAKLLTRIPNALISYSSAAMSQIVTPAGMPTFIEEASTLPETGAGDHVISSKRRTWDEVTSSRNADEISALKATVGVLGETITNLTATVFALSAMTQSQQAELDTHTAALSCGAPNRRLAEEPAQLPSVAGSEEPVPSPQDIVAGFMAQNPDVSAKLDDEMKRRLGSQLGQAFGLPALA